MDVRQLEFFIAVAEEGTFTRAAERSFVSQPGLSASIRSLERELGAQLFTRGRHGASLTSPGATFRARAERILEQVREAQRAVLSDEPGRAQLRIGAEQCLGGAVDIVDLLSSFAGEHPTADLEFVQDVSSRLVPMLDEGRLDVALIAAPAGAAPVDNSLLLRREPFVVLSPDDVPYTALGDLQGVRTVDFGGAWEARRVLDAALATAGARRRTVVEANDVHMLVDLVTRGFGIAVVPESIAAKQAAQHLVHTTLSDAPEWEVHLATGADPSPSATAFASMFVPQADIVRFRGHLAVQL
ncbi:LysR family transcriptional regulator [Kocuria sp. KH4]